MAPMADSYIDQMETVSYGRFAAAQILSLVVGLDPALDGAAKEVSSRVRTASDEMAAVLRKTGQFEVLSYSTDPGKDGPVRAARELFRRLVKYVESRDNGKDISRDLRGGDTLSTLLRRRPVKLAAALHHALDALHHHQAHLPEYDQWRQRLSEAATALDTLNAGVRQSRVARRAMTPEVAVCRERWLVTYAAAKRIVEGILLPLGKTSLLPQIFDDLAEVHRVPGVSEEAPSPPPPTPSPGA